MNLFLWNKVMDFDYRSMLRTVCIVKHVISKTQVRILTGWCQKVEEDLLIMACSTEAPSRTGTFDSQFL